MRGSSSPRNGRPIGPCAPMRGAAPIQAHGPTQVADPGVRLPGSRRSVPGRCLKEWVVVAHIPKVIGPRWLAVAAVRRTAPRCPCRRPASAAPTAATLYQEAMATTKAWRVHYVSKSNISHVPFFESGDAGPASGTQTILVGKGATLDTRQLDRHRRPHLREGERAGHGGSDRPLADGGGDRHGSLGRVLEQQPGLLSSRRRRSFTRRRPGSRAHRVPYTLGRSAPAWTATPWTPCAAPRSSQGDKTMDAVLYVRASGRHVLVEEDTVDAQGKPERRRAHRLLEVG